MADYTHTIDRWDEATGESLIERIAGVSAYLVALETYRVAVKLAHEKNSSMSLLTIWKLAPTATHTNPILASLLCFKSAFFNGSLSHLPTAIPAACSGASNTARAVQ
jgi:hypothetical protein